jgi:hypothetical protein
VAKLYLNVLYVNWTGHVIFERTELQFASSLSSP